MTLKLRDLAEPGGSLKKVLLNLVRSLRGNLQKLPDSSDHRIHEIRVCAKKLRSLLRLAAPVVEEAEAKRIVRRLRKLKDAYAGFRDADVMRARLGDLWPPAEAEEIRRRLGLPDESAAHSVKTAAAATIRQAGKFEKAIAALDLEQLSLAQMRKNLLKTYRRARRLMRSCRKDRRDALMHEWRKRVKDYYYQASALSALPLLAKAVRPADNLAEILGEYHDLAMLAARAAERDAESALIDRIALAKRQAGDRAFKKAAILFAARPRELSARLSG